MGMAAVSLEPLHVPLRCSQHRTVRCKRGPTGKTSWLIIVDACWLCGIMRPVKPTSWKQRHWLRRCNNRVGKASPS